MRSIFLLFILITLFSCQSNNTEDMEAGTEASAAEAVVSYDDSIDNTELEVELKTGIDSLALMKLPASAINIAGSYEMLLGADGHFNVTLKQRGAYISGSYCGYNETRVDCGMPSQGVSDCQIYGEMRKDTAYIRFMSCYMGKEGTAIIVKQGKHIYWTTTRFPKADDGGMSYCGVPSEGIIRSVERESLKLVKFNTLSPIEFSFSNRDIGKKSPSFSLGQKFLTQSLSKSDGFVQNKKEIEIIEKVGSYVFASDKKKDISKELKILSCRMNENHFYLKEDCMPIKSFQDNLNNWFLFGMDEINKNLCLKVFNQGSLLDVHTFKIPVFGLDDFGQNYAETYFKVIALRQNSFMHLAFFRLDYESRQCEGIRGSELFYWNGYKLNQLQIPDERIRDAYEVEESIIFPSDLNGKKDTIILNIRTADYGGADERINEQNFTFYFVKDGMKLKCLKN